MIAVHIEDVSVVRHVAARTCRNSQDCDNDKDHFTALRDSTVFRPADDRILPKAVIFIFFTFLLQPAQAFAAVSVAAVAYWHASILFLTRSPMIPRNLIYPRIVWLASLSWHACMQRRMHTYDGHIVQSGAGSHTIVSSCELAFVNVQN